MGMGNILTSITQTIDTIPYASSFALGPEVAGTSIPGVVQQRLVIQDRLIEEFMLFLLQVPWNM